MIERFDAAHAHFDLGDDVAGGKLRQRLKRDRAAVFLIGVSASKFEFVFGFLFLVGLHGFFLGRL